MKVGIVVGWLSERKEHNYVPVLYDMFRELGDSVDLHVFAMRSPTDRGQFCTGWAQIHCIGGGKAHRAQRLPMFGRALQALIKEHRRGHFDVLHGLGIDECGSTVVAAGRMLRVPTVISVMGGELVGYQDLHYGSGLTRSNTILARLALRGARRVTVAGRPVARQAEGALSPSQHHKITHFVLGIDPTPFEQVRPRKDIAGSFRLLHVAGLRPPKDQSLLLRAFSRFRSRDPGAHLHIAGGGELRAALTAQVAALGMSDAVTFHGVLSRPELADLYHAADVLVISSRNEGECVAALEAALCGLPIVSTHVGVMADLAPRAALTVPPLDEESLASALEKARDPEIRRSLAAEARTLVRAEHTAARSVQKLLALYGQVM
jgi:glycosyltransferase involved in cell wall biosynthesis